MRCVARIVNRRRGSPPMDNLRGPVPRLPGAARHIVVNIVTKRALLRLMTKKAAINTTVPMAATVIPAGPLMRFAASLSAQAPKTIQAAPADAAERVP
jgi:hypothetical protein